VPAARKQPGHHSIPDSPEWSGDLAQPRCRSHVAPPPPWLLLASFRSNPRSLQNREEEKKAQARTKLRRDGNPIGISARVQANWWFFTERSEKYAASKDDETEEASFFVAKVSPLNGKENSSKPKNLRTVLALLSPPPPHKKNEYSPSPACLWENSCYKNTENHKKIYQEDCTPRVNLLVVFRLCFAGGILLRRLRILRQRNDTDLGRLESLGVWVCVWLTLFLSLSLSFFLRNSLILKLRVQLFFSMSLSLALSLALLAQFADPANCDLNCLIQECYKTTCTMEHSNITTYYRDHFFSQFGWWGLLILLRGGCCCSKTFQKNETVLFCLLYRFPTLLPHPLIKSKSISLASVLPSLLTFFFSFLQTFNEKRTRQSKRKWQLALNTTLR